MKEYRFSRSSRRHKIGKASARYVIEHTEPVIGVSDRTGEPTYTWVDLDERAENFGS